MNQIKKMLFRNDSILKQNKIILCLTYEIILDSSILTCDNMWWYEQFYSARKILYNISVTFYLHVQNVWWSIRTLYELSTELATFDLFWIWPCSECVRQSPQSPANSTSKNNSRCNFYHLFVYAETFL